MDKLSFNSTEYTLNIPKSRLRVAVRRYQPAQGVSRPKHSDIAIVMTHGVSFLKELWEPTIAHIIHLQSSQVSPFSIRDIWTLDCPSHGQSASLNDEVCSQRNITFTDYGDAILALLASNLVSQTIPLVGIGHSFGSPALLFAEKHRRQFSSPSILPDRFSKSLYEILIMLEPPMLSPALEEKYDFFHPNLVKFVHARRRTWRSLTEAQNDIHTKRPWNAWDPRVRTLFATYGLRTSPLQNETTVLCCAEAQEEAAYSLVEEAESLEILSEVCSTTPTQVHTIFGSIRDLAPGPDVQPNITDPRQGRRMASVSRIEDVGHMAPFQRPEACAEAIYSILCRSFNNSDSKL
ncbi:hypothetical protein GYMLUDRAFT_43255 [Collybiopsis luxurians FD-317 M1]|uniref:AB hydrolase-1 domain-containing protein n=1 Tax=Collybiopsis luxurians FD-317 M1 TaxID=944289 RepID=A0A0D0CQ90_9AGAR|nr:hypothetical protein GYMLUDRAFT_43255 [Collybiopsis luxurians FD-317 M1]